MNKEIRHKIPSELLEEEAKEELTALAEEIKIHDIEYYEDNLDLIWKRRKRPKAVLEGKEEAFKNYVPFKGRFKQNQLRK